MSLRPPEIHILERLGWIAILVALTIAEVRTIVRNDANNTKDRGTWTQTLTNSNALLGLTQQELEILQSQSRSPEANAPHNKEALAKAWGKASQLSTKAIEGATSTPQFPAQLQTGRRYVSAEKLALALKDQEHSTATIINDGTNEAGNFANQLEIGLQNAGWQVGGNNIKIGDAALFPDSLTVEISSNPASPEDHSMAEGNALINALRGQGVSATLRLTTLIFPPNFMRIKVSGQ